MHSAGSDVEPGYPHADRNSIHRAAFLDGDKINLTTGPLAGMLTRSFGHSRCSTASLVTALIIYVTPSCLVAPDYP